MTISRTSQPQRKDTVKLLRRGLEDTGLSVRLAAGAGTQRTNLSLLISEPSNERSDQTRQPADRAPQAAPARGSMKAAGASSFNAAAKRSERFAIEGGGPRMGGGVCGNAGASCNCNWLARGPVASEPRRRCVCHITPRLACNFESHTSAAEPAAHVSSCSAITAVPFRLGSVCVCVCVCACASTSGLLPCSQMVQAGGFTSRLWG